MKYRSTFSTLLTTLALLSMPPAHAQTLEGPALADALREGGKVIVMRHANSPREEPDAASANPDNTARERQLDAKGREDAQAMGEALRRLRIPVNEVLSSPTYRALETARLLGVPDAQPQDELGNQGMAAAGEERAAWLREQVSQPPAEGNRLLITHGPNLSAAFPEHSRNMGEGDALIFAPGQAEPIGRVKIADWPAIE